MIETLTAEHFDEILPIFRQVQTLHVDARPSTFRSDWSDAAIAVFFAERLRDGAVCLVHRSADVVTGYLVYRIIETPQTPIKRAERFGMLDEVAVDADHRRQGVGRQLIAAMRARLSDADVGTWRVTYHDFNAASAALMASVGATPVVHVAEGRA